MENLTGKQFGAYRIVAPLGKGGMASVYKAYQANMDRYVALKIIPRHFANGPAFVKRFEHEARVIAKLEHPRILPVYEYGEAEGYSYLVMRFVQGGDLASSMAAQKLNAAQICKVTTEVASALDYAHSKGVIHRDVKPSNILIDEQGNCLLSDFGLAKIMSVDSALSVSGTFTGTPVYASPEQCMGMELDSRSDIYSLGVILYELYTGQPPFQAETPMGVILKHINDPLPVPSTVNPAISEVVERIILKALAKKPEDRFQTAGELAAALRVAENQLNEPAVPSPLPLAKPAAPPTTWLFARWTTTLPENVRKPGFFIPGAVVALILLGLALWAGLSGIKILPSKGGSTPTALAAANATPLKRTTLQVATRTPALPTPIPTSTFTPVPLLTVAVNPVPKKTQPLPTKQPEETWLQAPGLPSRVNAVVLHPENPRMVFAGTGNGGSGGGVFRSEDGGRSWKRVANGLPSEAVLGLAFAPRASTRLYAVVENSLYASDDLGESWTLLSSVMGASSGSANQLVPSADGTVLFAVPGSAGVFRSADQGAAWIKANDGLPVSSNDQVCVQSLAVAPSNAKIVYAGTGSRWECANGVYKSTDGGLAWQPANREMMDIGITALAVHPEDANIVYAGAYSGEIFKSADGGENWQALRKKEGSGFESSIHKILINEAQPEQIFVMDATKGVLMSDDGGAHWKLFGKPAENFRFPYMQGPLGVAFGEPPTLFIGSDESGLWIYAKKDFMGAATPTATAAVQALEPLPGSGQWTQIEGLPKTINSAAVDPANPQVIFVGTGQRNSGAGVYKSEDSGQTWNESMSGLPREDASFIGFDGGSRLYAIVGEGLYSSDGGTAWQKTNKNAGQYFYPEELVLSPDGQLQFSWYGSSGLYRSTDGGASWTKVTEGLPLDSHGDVSIDSLTVDPSNPQIVYVGTGANNRNGNGVYKSVDGGLTWTAANANMLDQDVTALLVDPKNGQTVYAGVDGGGLYKSEDGGQSWTVVREIVQKYSNWVRALFIDPQSGRLFMVTNKEGIMASGDGGLHWQVFGRPGQSSGDDIQVAAVSYAPQLAFYISTRVSGFWKFSILP